MAGPVISPPSAGANNRRPRCGSVGSYGFSARCFRRCFHAGRARRGFRAANTARRTTGRRPGGGGGGIGSDDGTDSTLEPGAIGRRRRRRRARKTRGNGSPRAKRTNRKQSAAFGRARDTEVRRTDGPKRQRGQPESTSKRVYRGKIVSKKRHPPTEEESDTDRGTRMEDCTVFFFKFLLYLFNETYGIHSTVLDRCSLT